jgi:hypothetical protein
MSRLAMVSTGWKTISSMMPTYEHKVGEHVEFMRAQAITNNIPDVPEPNTRAVPDSLPFPEVVGDMLMYIYKKIDWGGMTRETKEE